MSDNLEDLLSRTDVTRRDKILAILSNAQTPLSVSEIKQTAKSLGLRKAATWNISQILGSSNGLAVSVSEGWKLTSSGTAHVIENNLAPVSATPHVVIVDLREHLKSISNSHVQKFVEEAILCFEYKLYRSAVVLSWVGAVAVLYDYIVDEHLETFNREAKRRNAKWRDAKNSDDLSRMKESEFLEVLVGISIIGKNVKQELQNSCLNLRNACGHPNSLSIAQSRVAAHIEVLIANVFSKFCK